MILGLKTPISGIFINRYQNDTFELREAITPFGNADNLDFGNTYLWNQPIDKLRIFRHQASLIGQFLHEN
jgi:hypothetical protein